MGAVSYWSIFTLRLRPTQRMTGPASALGVVSQELIIHCCFSLEPAGGAGVQRLHIPSSRMGAVADARFGI